MTTRDQGRAQRRSARQAREDLSDYTDHKFWSYVHDDPHAQEIDAAKARVALQAAHDKITNLMKQEGLL